MFLLLIHICKLSYFIGYRYPNLMRKHGPPQYFRTGTTYLRCRWCYFNMAGFRVRGTRLPLMWARFLDFDAFWCWLSGLMSCTNSMTQSVSRDIFWA